MIRVEDIEVFGWDACVRGMRNPMNSWDRSDTIIYPDVEVGKKDMKLMKQLFAAGTEHRKYLRMLHVQMDIVAPLYWWKEFDTYKIGTAANSCSTMHKIAAKEFELKDFSTDHLEPSSLQLMEETIKVLNLWRMEYLENMNKKDWWQMIQLLPSSYNQRRTVDITYEVAARIIDQRMDHKLDEWRVLVNELLQLPYLAEIRG